MYLHLEFRSREGYVPPYSRIHAACLLCRMYLPFINPMTICIVFDLFLTGKRLEALSLLEVPSKLAYDVLDAMKTGFISCTYTILGLIPLGYEGWT